MRVRVIAVGQRAPAWIQQGWSEYAVRLQSSLKLQLVELPYGRRAAGADAARAIAGESQRILAAVKPADFVVALDERGREMSTRECADWLALRMREGADIALLIGGPDGLGEDVLARAQSRWSLSKLTFPHALVRVLLAEQLYRAHSLLTNHPYHRE